MKLTFEDALRIAKNCTDYGWPSDLLHEAFHYGIQTVVQALSRAVENEEPKENEGLKECDKNEEDPQKIIPFKPWI